MIEMKITVIVPVYNVEKYIRKCIESIIGQTYRNLEILLVDDGSPDGCRDICMEYARLDHRIKVIQRDNGGLSAARNTGIEAATGELIAFIDGDDYIDKDMIKKLYSAMIREEADMAVCGYTFIHDNGEVEARISAVKDEVLDRQGYYNKLCDEQNYYFVTAWNKLYKRTLWEQIRFPEGKFHEDEFTIHHLVDKCKKIVTISSCLYWYVQRRDSIMSQKISASRFDGNEALCDRCLFFKEKGQKICLSYTLERLLRDNGNLLLQFRPRTSAEKVRVKEVNELIRNTYIKCAEHISKSRKLRLLFPKYIVKARRICLRLKHGVELLLNTLVYRVKLCGAEYVLIDTPTHGNLGDHAIVLSQQQLIHNLGKRYVELTASQINHRERYFAAITPRNKKIIIPGGGFLGELWIEEEYRVRRIIKAFKEQKIIIFPQTLTFVLNEPGNIQFFHESRYIYEEHKDLVLFVREKKSFDFVKEYMPKVKCDLEPDIVLGLNWQTEAEQKRKNILLCMRSDCEKKYTDDTIKKVMKKIQDKYPSSEIIRTSTVLDKEIKPKDRKKCIMEKLREFSSAKLVLTDRLHGMIFAAITGTPCIAINNKNGKVEQVYHWINELEYVHFVEDIQIIDKILGKIDFDKKYVYRDTCFFKKIITLIAI